jgi:hypothetical protein
MDTLGLNFTVIAFSSTCSITRQREIAGNLPRNQKDIDPPLMRYVNQSGIFVPGKENILFPASTDSCESKVQRLLKVNQESFETSAGIKTHSVGTDFTDYKSEDFNLETENKFMSRNL